MAANWTDLKAEVADTLNRADLTAAIPIWISLAEAKFRRDDRLRKLAHSTPFDVVDSDEALPADYNSIVGWYHRGPVLWGEIEIVGADQIGRMIAHYGESGPPRFAAIIDKAEDEDPPEWYARLAPAPDTTYSTELVYARQITALGAGQPANWLLTSHPDVYLYGTLVHSAPYLKDDARTQLWMSLLEDAIDSVHLQTWNAQFSGATRRQVRPIG